MRAYVLLEVPRRLEGLVAHVLGTLVGLLPRVRAQVALEPVAGGEGLATGGHVTAVRPVARVSTLVHLPRGGGRLTTSHPLTGRPRWTAIIRQRAALIQIHQK